MNRFSLGLWVLITLLATTEKTVATKQTDELFYTGGGFYFENDNLLKVGHQDDQNYTLGLALWRSGSWVEEMGLDWPLAKLDWSLAKLGGCLHIKIVDTSKDVFTGYHHSFEFGSSNFTPDSLNASNLEDIKVDRPYSSLIYLKVKRVGHVRRRLAMGNDLTVGVMGLRIAEAVQTGIHGYMRGGFNPDTPDSLKDTTPYDPKGWRHQVENGGTFVFKYGASGQWLILGDPEDKIDVRVVSLKVTSDLNLGYYTDASVGVGGHFGIYRSNWWQMETRPFDEGRDSGGRFCEDIELYLLAGARYRVVGYNAHLQGVPFWGRTPVHKQKPKRLLWEGEFGLAAGWQEHNLTYILAAGRGKEFKGATRSHKWGGIYYKYNRNLKAID